MKTVLCLLVAWCAPIMASAQQATPSPTKPTAPHVCCARRLPRRVFTNAPTAAPSSSPPAASDFYVGEARVEVTKDETVVRLAMAQHGSVLIELPANDGPRYIIPGDPEMATVDEKALEKNKRAIVVRPGTLFVSPPPTHKVRTPAATVTVQMRSGLVVTFLFYPIEDLALNVHRCVLTYNRDEVVARRRAAGLPVNLDTNTTTEKRNETGQSTAPISLSVDATADERPEQNSAPKPLAVNEPKKEIEGKPEVSSQSSLPLTKIEATPANPEKKASGDRVIAAARDALANAKKKPKQFKSWTKPVHGLSLAALPAGNAEADFRVVLIAVKNVTSEAVKVLPDMPDLSVEMLDDQSRPINVQSLKKLHTEADDLSGAIAAGGTTYYAIAFVPPILGIHQQMKVSVSQSSAADEPATIKLAANAR